MSFSKVLLVALSITAVDAKPLVPSKVARAEPPEPSPYPLGEACGNEWEYLNFDPANEADQRLLRQLHDVICTGEVRSLASRGYTAAEEAKTGTNPVFNLFFDPGEETPVVVSDVLKMIRGDDSSSASFIGAVVGEMVVDNKDFSQDFSCDDEGELAYTDDDEADGLQKIHFCPIAYEKPNLESIDCGALDSFPSEKMDTFSRVVLHEITHGENVGPESELSAQIKDIENDDEGTAYGINRAHALVREKIGQEVYNADNYAYMSLDAWVSWDCTPADNRDAWASFFPDPPPDYE
ncbi:uncharacterized protein FIESC28_01846 [Fusarium coffeatum]|uniref:Lysine-specific metallo-endopeptidase domain-containing protein n=1 Tax=Fusarium coffeatum TaxID=231269 RepID=A0A366S7Y5_9HYPO|nr:uncharacterized protein FIESC28_01846 [Fusarium coffeatum]RBR25409.1 hypothetical protein FIESC28_01846 [Fusarium coffeatum]